MGSRFLSRPFAAHRKHRRLEDIKAMPKIACGVRALPCAEPFAFVPGLALPLGDILHIFFMEPWSVDASLKAIRPEMISAASYEPAVHWYPHFVKIVDLESVRHGILNTVLKRCCRG